MIFDLSYFAGQGLFVHEVLPPASRKLSGRIVLPRSFREVTDEDANELDVVAAMCVEPRTLAT